MNRIIKFALYTIAWGAIVAYVILSSTRVAHNRASLSLDSIKVRVIDSTQQSHLVGERKVYQWIESSGYAKLGEPISQVNLSGIESVVGGNGFISQVSAYTNSQGVLHVDVKQREPILRLRLDGYDSYITEDGFIFLSPVGSAHYSLVATGSYKPIFPAGYQGYIDDVYHAKLVEFDQCIDDVEREKYPFFEQQRKLRAEWTEFYRTGYVKKRFMESDSDYAIRLKEKKLSNRARRSELNHQARIVVRKIEQIEQKRIKIVASKNLFIQKHEDFKKLIIFAKGLQKTVFGAQRLFN